MARRSKGSAERTGSSSARTAGGGGGQRGADQATRTADKGQDQVAGWTTIVVGALTSGFLMWRNHSDPPMGFSEYNLLNTAVILWIPLSVIMLLLKREPAEFGMTVGDVKWGLRWALLLFAAFVPVILLFAPNAGPQQYYLNWMGPGLGSGAVQGIYYDYARGVWSAGGRIDWARLAYHELVMGFYMFGWEWYFRGFLLTGSRRILPVWAAVLLQSLFFTALHWGKPLPEVASSFPGGILMGILAVRFQSFLPCFVLHWLVSAGFDAAVLYFHFRR